MPKKTTYRKIEGKKRFPFPSNNAGFRKYKVPNKEGFIQYPEKAR